MADFDRPWILDELSQQSFQIFSIQRCVLERDGELNQQGTEFSGGGQGFESLTRQALVFIIGPDGRGRGRFHGSHG